MSSMAGARTMAWTPAVGHRTAESGAGRQTVVAVVAATVAVLLTLLAGDWIAGLSILVLWAGWHWLTREEGPPVLALAFTFQWVQVVSGLHYYALTGRRLPAMDLPGVREMMLIGLGCLVALLAGMALGSRLIRPVSAAERRPIMAFSWNELLILYVASVALSGVLQEVAWRLPSLTQAILGLTLIRFGLLFLLLRRFVWPEFRWGWFWCILAFEVLLGFTGFFAGFKEALIIALLALLERFRARRASHWVATGAVVTLIVVTSVLWTGIKSDYRRDWDADVFADSRVARLERLTVLSSSWFGRDRSSLVRDVDATLDRLWAIYYPTLALSRVPDVLPHANGELLLTAIRHIASPRLLFPDKPDLASDSHLVRTYSGVWVAGPEQNTSIAFGYAIESYVDFGVPWMFLPVCAFGLIAGAAYRLFLRVIWHRELAVALVSVVFWLVLYLFERSWAKTLGFAGTFVIYLGGATLILDRYLLVRVMRYVHSLPAQPAPARPAVKAAPRPAEPGAA